MAFPTGFFFGPGLTLLKPGVEGKGVELVENDGVSRNDEGAHEGKTNVAHDSIWIMIRFFIFLNNKRQEVRFCHGSGSRA